MSSGSGLGSAGLVDSSGGGQQQSDEQQQPTSAGNDPPTPSIKKSRTNTPWSPAEEAMLRQKRDQGQTWGEIAKALSQVRITPPLAYTQFSELHDRELIGENVAFPPTDRRKCKEALV